jgi:F-type H+-transporting ATPase subunit b
MEIVTQSELVSINATLLVQGASFLIFLFLIERVMFRPLWRTVQDRRGYLQQLERDVKTKERKLAEMTETLEKEATALKEEAFRESEKLEASGKEEARGMIRQMRAEMISRQKTDTAEIQRRIEGLQQQLAGEVEPLAAQIIAKVLDRRMLP